MESTIMDADTNSFSTISSIGPSVSSVGLIGSVGKKHKRTNASDVYNFLLALDTGEAVRDCDEKLVKWIIVNSQAFAIVDLNEFVEFCKSLRPEYNVPCQQTIRKIIFNQWKAEKDTVRFEIRREVADRRASFTTDMWTSPSNRGYLVITIYFIDSSWEMRSLIITFTRVMYPHTGKRLADHFIRAVKDMDVALLRSIWTITADNATNNMSMVAEMNNRLQRDIERLMQTNLDELAEPGSPSLTPQNTSSARTVVQLRTTAHVLQLAVKEGLESCAFL
ncbi:unnamed protein product [Phytophthora fragariaefolia]|uniref:Unnamed protein product n=1 Tax=Phytophthora fragariaefolia TaxID=1490495 RepID=A0A9W7CY47_9STRA|nr:unnamed protein product [Phytophthora fragariaefolia]